jgi:hypothetical protein
VALSIATLAGCLSFDQLTGGEGSSVDASADGTIGTDAAFDATPPDDAPMSEFDSGPGIDCKSIDAELCDDFNRDAAIPFSDLRWNDVNCLAGDTLSVNGTLVTTAAPSTSTHCYLESKQMPNTSHFTLDFDLMFEAADAATPGGIVTIEISYTLMNPNADSGIESVIYQLILTANGNAVWQLVDFYPDAAASPDPGNPYAAYELANASPFIEPATRCHITLQANNTTLPSGAATSTCDGANPVTMNAASHPGARGLGGNGQLTIGFANNNQSNAPTWKVVYDNLVYRVQ